MYYIDGDKIYLKVGDKFINVGFEATYKVITHREFESITVVKGTQVRDSLPDLTPYSQDEIIAKFNLSEDNPIGIDIPAKEEVSHANTKRKR